MTRPVAVVYRGRASVPGCAEAAARVLALNPLGFRVEFSNVCPRSLSGVALYCQPGGGELAPAWRRLRREADAIRAFVAGGGRYLGWCLGGYLAGDDPGFGLLEGAVDSYAGTAGAEVLDEAPRVVETDWAGVRREVYFQDGCHFTPGTSTEVVARYRNGLPAAVVSPYGAGRVAVCGPHPEATEDWFVDDGLPVPRERTDDLAHDLIRRLMVL